jgi:hypothetical protein
MVMRAAHTRCRVTSPGPSMPSGGSGRSLLLESDKGFYFRMQRRPSPGSAKPDLSERWPSRLVATPSATGLKRNLIYP